jgi:hypothetical protein
LFCFRDSRFVLKPLTDRLSHRNNESKKKWQVVMIVVHGWRTTTIAPRKSAAASVYRIRWESGEAGTICNAHPTNMWEIRPNCRSIDRSRERERLHRWRAYYYMSCEEWWEEEEHVVAGWWRSPRRMLWEDARGGRDWSCAVCFSNSAFIVIEIVID